MELDPKVRDQETAMVKGRARAIGLVKVRRLEERKELRKKPKSKPDLKTRIEGLRTIESAQTKKAGANIIVGLHVLCPGLFDSFCGANGSIKTTERTAHIQQDEYRLATSYHPTSENLQLSNETFDNLSEIGSRAGQFLLDASFPKELSDEIRYAYKQLEGRAGTNVSLAVRISATAEDLPSASFAGQQESYLNVQGEENLIAA